MAFDYQKDEQNIVTVTMDMPGRSANVINDEFSKAMMTTVDKLEQEDSLAGVIITSAKKTFLAGGDLEMLFQQEDPEATFKLVEKGKALSRKLETLGKPLVAAINGTALGGGLELALCCKKRICIDKNSIFGLPETTIGIIPGAGGTYRLPKIVGIDNAKEIICTGKKFGVSKALKYGLIDDILNSEELGIEVKNSSKSFYRSPSFSISAAENAEKSINFGLNNSQEDSMKFELEQYKKTLSSPERIKALKKYQKK